MEIEKINIMNNNFCLFSAPRDGKKLVWEVTSRCNMKCKHCCSNASLSSDCDSFNLSEDILDEIMNSGIKDFYISGGEPFIEQNLMNFLKYLKKNNKRVNVATNGYLFTEKLIKDLSEIKINLLHLSLDGHKASIYNHLRGGDFFDKVVENIKILVKYGIPVRLGCIIWKKNEKYLEKMVNFCISLGVQELRLGSIVKVGRFKDNISLSPERDNVSIIKEVVELQEKYKDKILISMHRNPFGKKGLELCPGGKDLFFLSPEGYLSPCSWVYKTDQSFTTKESLHKKNFKELTESKEISSFRKMVERRKAEKMIGCPFMAKYQNKSYYSNDVLPKISE